MVAKLENVLDIPGEDNCDQAAPFIPTPEQIRATCSQIQAKWSKAERRRRSRYFSQFERVELQLHKVIYDRS